jgi:bacterioferritin (cytochrome b1)
VEKLAKKNKDKVIDVLCERLCFERSGVKLYDKILERMRQSKEPAITKMLEQMQEHRDQEKEHEEWLEDCIRKLGGDDKKMTEKAKLVTEESKGIEEVIMKDPQLPHLFHALLAAELVDNAGWDLLVQLADEADDTQAKRDFKKRLHEEEEHLILMREVMKKLSLHEILGERLQMPTQP